MTLEQLESKREEISFLLVETNTKRELIELEQELEWIEEMIRELQENGGNYGQEKL